MTSEAARAAALALLLAGSAAGAARAADGPFPFEGTWVRANRVCAANAPRTRSYTARDVTFPNGHCTYRKVVGRGGQFEIFEDCRKADHPGNYTETIRMLGPDLMQMRRQANRLKIARSLRYARCTAAASAPGEPPPPKPGVPPAGRRSAEEHGGKAPEPKPPEAPTP